jgi:peptide/nickel transport system permease protein
MIARRVGLGLITLWLVSVLVFAATQLLPGDAANAILGRNATPAGLAAVRRELHLDTPFLTQYWLWISNLLSGNPGHSLANGTLVTSYLGSAIENSAFLVAVSGLFGIPFAIGIGVTAALLRTRPFDHVIGVGLLVLAALPEFVIGIILIFVLSTNVFHLVPSVSLLAPGVPPWDHLDLIILPALTLILAITPYIARMMRASMIEVLESDYVEMARLKGMSPRRVVVHHAIRNALVPATQVSALCLAWMAGGVVLVEYVFAYPGIGSALVDAVNNRDIPVIQFITLLVGAVYVALNVGADVVTILLTPKLRTGSR